MISRRALFLDKDGVINVNHGYVCSTERTDFIDGIFQLCRFAKARDWLLVVVTNQAGIARGYYTEDQFVVYMDWVRQTFAARGAALDAVYYCPHHPVHGIGAYRKDCSCRKPKPGMLLAAQREWHIDMASSLLLGDSRSDIQAGVAAGVGRCLTVRASSGEGAAQTALDETFLREVHGLLDVERVENR